MSNNSSSVDPSSAHITSLTYCIEACIKSISERYHKHLEAARKHSKNLINMGVGPALQGIFIGLINSRKYWQSGEMLIAFRQAVDDNPGLDNDALRLDIFSVMATSALRNSLLPICGNPTKAETFEATLDGDLIYCAQFRHWASEYYNIYPPKFMSRSNMNALFTSCYCFQSSFWKRKC
jgi:hypothetical protein